MAKSDCFLEMGAPKPDSYPKVRRSVSYRHESPTVEHANVRWSAVCLHATLKSDAFLGHTLMLREKKIKSRTSCHENVFGNVDNRLMRQMRPYRQGIFFEKERKKEQGINDPKPEQFWATLTEMKKICKLKTEHPSWGAKRIKDEIGFQMGKTTVQKHLFILLFDIDTGCVVFFSRGSIK